jgi:hypothetical protein
LTMKRQGNTFRVSSSRGAEQIPERTLGRATLSLRIIVDLTTLRSRSDRGFEDFARTD